MKMMKFNSSLSFLITCLMFLISGMTLIFSVMLFFKGEICLEFEAVMTSSNKISVILLFDFVSMFFCSSVTLISGSVILFNSSYMEKEKFSNRFTFIVYLFIMSMMFLIFSPSVVSLLLGWDGLGVTSYLLVCYYSSEKSFNASMLTALTNRLGDVLILMFISLNSTPGLFNFSHVSFSNQINYYFIILIIIAAMTKSAQIPFSAWLPAAMAAPTPVSALVHSSTLVTAGIYLILRFNYSMSLWLNWMLWAGALTTMMAGLAALMEMDMKKIIALSTLSQLGMMMFTLGMGEPILCWVHLISHAYFKAMLFMGAGSMIHSMKDYQDLRKMGSWMKTNQFIGSIFITGSMSLCGLPFLTGFFSKDSILEQMMMSEVSLIIFFFIFLSTFCTSNYSIRIMILLFKNNSLRESYSSESMSLGRMSAGIVPLTLYSIAGGWILFSFLSPEILVVLPLWLKMSVLVGVIGSSVLFFFFSGFIYPKNIFYSSLHQMWFLPVIISPGLSNKGLMFSKVLFKEQEVSWLSWLFMKMFFVEKNMNYLSSFLNSKIMIYLILLIILILLLLI